MHGKAWILSTTQKQYLGNMTCEIHKRYTTIHNMLLTEDTQESREAFNSPEMVDSRTAQNNNSPDVKTWNDLPPELILHILNLLEPDAAICVCLTSKKHLSLLPSKNLQLVKGSTSLTLEFLRSIERDLEWDQYACSRCYKIHQYEQLQTDHCRSINRLLTFSYLVLQDSVRVLKTKYLHGLQSGNPRDHVVPLSFCYERATRRYWGYLNVKQCNDGNIYARSQVWIRYVPHLGKLPNDRSANFTRSNCCFRVARANYRSNVYGGMLDGEWQRRNGMHLAMVTGSIVPAQAANTTFPELDTHLPKHWCCHPLRSCETCGADVSIHYGLWPVCRDDEIAVDTVFDSSLHEPQDPQSTLRQIWSSELDEWRREGRPEPLFWSDTVVVTTWSCLGPDWLDSDRKGSLCNKPEYLPMVDKGATPKVGWVKAAFDGEPDRPYHPLAQGCEKLKPIWSERFANQPQSKPHKNASNCLNLDKNR